MGSPTARTDERGKSRGKARFDYALQGGGRQRQIRQIYTNLSNLLPYFARFGQICEISVPKGALKDTLDMFANSYNLQRKSK